MSADSANILAWHEAAGHDRAAFAKLNLTSFADFWNLEKHTLEQAAVTPVRQHLHRWRKTILRQTVSIRLDKVEYFLKRADDEAYPWVVNEHQAIGQIAQFGLVPPRLVAAGFDPRQQRGILLLKRLPGFDSLQDLLEFRSPPEVVADFQTRKKDFLKRLTRIVRRIQHADYFYPDWRDKHILLRRGSAEIALIDLERFRHLRQCPWCYRLPPVRHFIRRREWATLRHSLGSDLYTPRYLLNLLAE